MVRENIASEASTADWHFDIADLAEIKQVTTASSKLIAQPWLLILHLGLVIGNHECY